jgi:hypothetical protein
VVKKLDKEQSINSENVVDHPGLKRDRAFAQHLARCHVHRHCRPLPDPENISSTLTARLTAKMTKEQIAEALLAVLKYSGINVDMNE